MNTKTCKDCGITKEIDCFGKNQKGYYFRRCKTCSTAKRSQWNKDNPEKYQVHARRKVQKLKQKRDGIRLQIDKEKSKGCSYCGFNLFSECLQFHHIDPLAKEAEIGRMIAAARREKEITEEIKKCIVLCSNCHRALHNGDIEL